MVKLKNKRIVAATGLAAIVCIAAVLLAGAFVLNSSNSWKQFLAWRFGGEFLGTDGVLLQDKRNNCGPAALKMVFDHYGISSTLAEIEGKVGLTEKGSSMLALKEMAELKGLQAQGWRFTLADFVQAPMPAIVFVHGDHFAVVDSVSDAGNVYLRDPAVGAIKISQKKLPRIWEGETLVFYGTSK